MATVHSPTKASGELLETYNYYVIINNCNRTISIVCFGDSANDWSNDSDNHNGRESRDQKNHYDNGSDNCNNNNIDSDTDDHDSNDNNNDKTTTMTMTKAITTTMTMTMAMTNTMTMAMTKNDNGNDKNNDNDSLNGASKIIRLVSFIF